MRKVSHIVIASLLALSAAAQADVGEKATEAKDATVHAAKKTGQAVKTAASAVADTAKSVASGVAETATEVYHKGKRVTKKAVGATAEKTEEVAGKVKKSVSEPE